VDLGALLRPQQGILKLGIKNKEWFSRYKKCQGRKTRDLSLKTIFSKSISMKNNIEQQLFFYFFGGVVGIQVGYGIHYNVLWTIDGSHGLCHH